MKHNSGYGQARGVEESSTVILGTHRLTKVPVAIKVIFNDVNIEVNVADLPEVAISELLYK